MLNFDSKKFIAVLVPAFAALLLFSLPAGAQADISTRKKKISDFETKTTKVVLGGNDMFNLALKNEVARRWRVSPYEFISPQEFESTRTNANYYFLVPLNVRQSKEEEPGLMVLSLLKGGSDNPKDADETINVIDFPICPADNPSGREYVFLPAFIDIIQDFVLDAIRSDMVSYGGLDSFPIKLGKASKMTIFISSDDLGKEVEVDASWEEKGIEIVSEEEADRIFSEGRSGAIVSYVVAPDTPDKSSLCYKMLISADTHEVFYLKKHKLGPAGDVGLQKKDMFFISKMKKK